MDIFSSLKLIIDILIKDVDPIIYNDENTTAIRYFWSSMENVTLIFFFKCYLCTFKVIL